MSSVYVQDENNKKSKYKNNRRKNIEVGVLLTQKFSCDKTCLTKNNVNPHFLYSWSSLLSTRK